MTLSLPTGELRWRVLLKALPDAVYDMLATDEGRERFWVERSTEDGEVVSLWFPDQTTTTLVILAADPPNTLKVRYFDTATTFTLDPVEDGTVLEVRASNVPAEDVSDVAAGWVSVLLNLKAVVNFGIDLRNHDPARCWQQGFIDN